MDLAVATVDCSEPVPEVDAAAAETEAAPVVGETQIRRPDGHIYIGNGRHQESFDPHFPEGFPLCGQV